MRVPAFVDCGCTLTSGKSTLNCSLFSIYICSVTSVPRVSVYTAYISRLTCRYMCYTQIQTVVYFMILRINSCKFHSRIVDNNVESLKQLYLL